MSCLSHPDKKLIDHLDNVKDIGLSILNDKKYILPSYWDDLKYVLKIILFYHDFGKATKFFQDYLKASINRESCNHASKLTKHSLISACVSAFKIKNELKQSQNNLLFSILGFLAVRKHHGNLEQLDEMLIVKNWQVLEEQWENIDWEFKKDFRDINFNDIKDFVENLLWESDNIKGKIDNYLLLNFLFSILTYSDKTEVIIGKPETLKFPTHIDRFVDNYKNKKFVTTEKTKLNNLREDAYSISLKNLLTQYKNGNIFSLNLPTGAGKTLTVLNLAFNFIKKDSSLKKIIYALPFTSIVDQTEKIIREIFKENNCNIENYLIVHHHLAEVKIKHDENYITGDKAEFLIENWDKPFILTTFWQLFNSIIASKNSQLRKFHNIANSVIILDEIQSIPYKYWELTNKVFKTLTELFNCKIIFMTATMPLIFDEEKKEIISIIPKKERDKYFSAFSRYNIKIINKLNDITIDELYKIAQKDIKENSDKSFLFVFNTKKTSIKFFEMLKMGIPNKKLFYLSSNILPFERKKRVENIINDSNIKIIVSTQVIEAGVDIDLDIVYRDFAPLDSIIQSAGRCNRNNKKKLGMVKLFRLKNDKDQYDYNIYKGLALNATYTIFDKNKKETIPENEVLNLINKYYKQIKTSSSKKSSKEILEAIENLQYEYIEEKFKIIDELPSFLMFFEINDTAKNILQRFSKIIEIKDRFERKNELLKIKSKFYQYILSVSLLSEQMRSYYNSFEEIGHLKIVRHELVDSIYDSQTGLKIEFNPFL